MPQLTQQEADLALHAYGQRMRKLWAERDTEMKAHLAAFKETVRDAWGREHTKPAEPKIEAPKIEPPEISPPGKAKEDPDLGR